MKSNNQVIRIVKFIGRVLNRGPIFRLTNSYHCWERSFKKRAWLSIVDRYSSIHKSIEITGGGSNPYSNITIGKECEVQKDCCIWIANFSDADPSFFIGDRVFVGRDCIFSVYKPLTIGKNTLIGAFSYILTCNHNFMSRNMPIRDQGYVSAPVAIAEDVWIGTHVVILPGVTIGKGAIIAAGSVVDQNIPAYEVWGGVPAKFIKVRPM